VVVSRTGARGVLDQALSWAGHRHAEFFHASTPLQADRRVQRPPRRRQPRGRGAGGRGPERCGHAPLCRVD